jgi:indole-3-glycerol phosphate synthase
MNDFIAKLAGEVQRLVETGYYDVGSDQDHRPVSLANVIERSERTLITELKFSSPSQGEIRSKEDEATSNGQITSLVSGMEEGGASGISVLTQPLYFKGSLESLKTVRAHTQLPLLMKDIIIDRRQIDAGAELGADLILLISRLFSADRSSIASLVEHAHSKSLEVLLEVNNLEEYERAIKSNADIIGINNRDLGSLQLDFSTTRLILSSGIKSDKPLISESGFFERNQIDEIARLGVRAFLIGTAIMKSKDVRAKVRELSGTPRRDK